MVRRFARWVSVLAAALSTVGTAGLTSASAARPVGAITSVSCPTLSTCVAIAAPQLLRTTNGGRAWVRLAPPSQLLHGPRAGALTGLSCPGLRRCELVGATWRDDGAIWGTADGGAHWTEQLTAVTGGLFLAVACATVRVCEATANDRSVYGTNDGGRTWSRQGTPGFFNAISCPTVRVCEAIGVTAARTTDGGRTWTTRLLPDALATLLAVWCPSTERCVAAGYHSRVAGGSESAVTFRTTDGGRSWTATCFRARRRLPSRPWTARP